MGTHQNPLLPPLPRLHLSNSPQHPYPSGVPLPLLVPPRTRPSSDYLSFCTKSILVYVFRHTLITFPSTSLTQILIHRSDDARTFVPLSAARRDHGWRWHLEFSSRSHMTAPGRQHPQWTRFWPDDTKTCTRPVRGFAHVILCWSKLLD